MAVAQQAPRPQAPQGAPSPQQAERASGNAGEVTKGKKRWIVIEVTPQQSQALREMARTSGGKAADFYSSLLAPAVDVAVKDFSENREARTAEARARQARSAAQRAQEIADKAEAEAAKYKAEHADK